MIEPAAGVAGQPLGRPLRRRRDQRLLDRILRGREVVAASGDGAEHLRRKVAQQGPDVGGSPLGRQTSGGPLMTCRTSTGMMSGLPPGPGAPEILAAIS